MKSCVHSSAANALRMRYDAMNRRHHQTQWAAQFAVASELCRRGNQVALTMGNHPKIDLMVLSPNGRPYFVDVKGQYKGPNPWPVTPKRKTAELLFYVFAFVPDPGDGSLRFTVLSQDEVNAHVAETTAKWKARKLERADKEDPMPCVSADYVKKNDGGWDKLPK
jgi:hypothetical protein